jgi:hypothetical protein
MSGQQSQHPGNTGNSSFGPSRIISTAAAPEDVGRVEDDELLASHGAGFEKHSSVRRRRSVLRDSEERVRGRSVSGGVRVLGGLGMMRQDDGVRTPSSGEFTRAQRARNSTRLELMPTPFTIAVCSYLPPPKPNARTPSADKQHLVPHPEPSPAHAPHPIRLAFTTHIHSSQHIEHLAQG